MNLPPFLMVQRPDNPDGLYILSTTPPYYLGHVRKAAQIRSLFAAKVQGYDIFIEPAGCMEKYIIEITTDHQQMLKGMADFFLSFKIQGQEPKYRKYLDSATTRTQ